MKTEYDVIIIGAGAAGLMCAIESGKRNRKTLLIDHAKAVGEKIRISGGGRCNFTNMYVTADNYVSQNPHFCKSALKRYTQYDFMKLVEDYKIDYHEKTLGQLFCDKSSQQIIDMLVQECLDNNVSIQTKTSVLKVNSIDDGFQVTVQKNKNTEQADEPIHIKCQSLVIATGGLSIPKMGATDFGIRIAKQFNLDIIPQRAGLVPLSFSDDILKWSKELSGIALDVSVTCNKQQFKEAMLFTHRGLSGPVILQISSYWHDRDEIIINMAPDIDVFSKLKELKQNHPKQDLYKNLANMLPKRLAQHLCSAPQYQKRLADVPHKDLQELADRINNWTITPKGTEGYRIAEVTIGGVNTSEVSSKTFETRNVPKLYFIGETLDVTGHLGGFNFQWAWSSGFAAGQYT